jgi:hypothetical protein
MSCSQHLQVARSSFLQSSNQSHPCMTHSDQQVHTGTHINKEPQSHEVLAQYSCRPAEQCGKPYNHVICHPRH